MTSTIAAAILNGGSARRMSGANKALLQIDGLRIAERQLEVLRQRCDSIAMVVGEREQAADLELEILFDRVGGLGPLDGIASALAWSPGDWLLVVACDMPYLSPDVIDALLAARSPNLHIVGAVVHGRPQPLLALYHKALLPSLDNLLGAGRLRASSLLSAPPEGIFASLLSENEILLVDPELRSFRNLNSPEDIVPSEPSIE